MTPTIASRGTPRAAAALGLATFALALAACGGGDDDATATAPPAPQARTCDTASMAGLALANAAVTAASAVPAGTYQPSGSGALANLPAFCRIDAQATPTSDSLVNFQVWVPEGAAWNGKIVVTGNGGYSPQLSYGDMAYAMRQGYAVVGGDTGHQSADPNAMFWGVGHPEKIRDWGSRSINAITGPSKKIAEALRAQAPSRAYYYGCSTGGHQAYAEMQRYPEDFDGIVAGAPGNNRTRLNVEFLHRFLVNRAPNTNSPVLLSAQKAATITTAAVAACDALDGVTDGVMEDPRACTTARFDVQSMLCAAGQTTGCLTQAEIDVAKQIYAGPKVRKTGANFYPGLVVGTESGWSGYWGGTEPVRADYWRLWTFGNPQWNWWSFDYDRDVQYADQVVSPLVDQTNPDLSAFRARGAKAIVYQGWADPVVNAADTIAYVDKVRALQSTPQATDSFLRLFLVPGMGHCSGGSGTSNFGNQGGTSPVLSPERDVLMALDRWVEQGTAPDRIVATRVVSGNAVRTRPLCVYPKKAVWNGTGSTDDAANFTCQ
jgi:feruloyl esterase